MNLGKNWKTGSPQASKFRNRGVLHGFIFPLLIMPIVLYLFYLDASRRFDPGYEAYALKVFSTLHNFCNVLSLSVLGNLILFFATLRRNNLWGARGILVSTMVYAALVFILKIIDSGLV
jgi:hypothetical protein